jgi:cyclopropane fatty-acyl-phospholipid synthase-like methyltransferase
MQLSTNTARPSYPFSVFEGEKRGQNSAPTNKIPTGWIIEQLNIQPYQHILEIGYGAGHTLQEISASLKNGFLAGIEPSLSRYRQALKRNKKKILEQLVQLHTGELHSLPYPHRYFHSIYGCDLQLSRKERQNTFIQLVNLLKSGGKLIMLFPLQSDSAESSKMDDSKNITDDFEVAGLINIQLSYRQRETESWIIAKGYRQ